MLDMKVKTLTGTDVMLDSDAVEKFRKGLRGKVLLGDDQGYNQAREVWNGMTDKKPSLIVQCTGVADVINAVNFAREHKLLVAVRGGAHSVAGHSVCDGGIVIDLSKMKSVRVDPEQRTARAEGGVKWCDFDYETQAFGLATTGGTNSDTGIAGLTLGGGIGWLGGKYGLTCDNLLSADVVTADGRFLRASAEENKDLFWGLRGGSGNFGIVTSFEYQLHQVGTLLAGMVIHSFERAKEVLSFYSDFSLTLPDEANTVAAMLHSPDGHPVIAIAVAYNGPLDKGEEVLRSLRQFGSPLADQIGPMSYLALQTMLDGAFPRGRQYYWKAHLSNQISGNAIDTIVEHFAAVPSPFTVVGFQQLGNATNRVAQDATAFSHRDALYDCLMLSGWDNPDEAQKNITWTRQLYEAMRPSLHAGIYVNAVGEDAEQTIHSAYRAQTYERLVTLKNQYDPTNLFRLNPNIMPTP
jgi:FAD/FMN-containing dehydrogenase